MTRGSAYLITDNEIYYHDEFNGGMYLEEFGDEFLDILYECTPENFDEKIKEFNEKHHKYNDFKTYKDELKRWTNIKIQDNKIIVDFNKEYHRWFFSDYVFFKNMSNKNIEFVLRGSGRNRETYILIPKAACRFCFGRIDETFTVIY